MGKNSNITKKGKQKAPTLAVPPGAPPPPSPSPPPPPLLSSPPAAHHIPYPPAAVDTIEEQEEFGHPLGGPLEGVEEESWQDGGDAADDWAADMAPENSNQDIGDSGWGPVAPAHLPPPSPQPPRKQSGGRKDRPTSHYPQQQPHLSLSTQQNSMVRGANMAVAHKAPATNWGHAKPQQPRDTWIPQNNGWGGNDDSWGDQDDPEDDSEWGAEDSWGSANGGWGHQPHSATWTHAVSAHSAHPKATSHAPTGGWQSWGEEAQRLPKVTFDPATPPSSSSAGNGNKPVLSQQQLLSELLNNSQQNQQPFPMPPNAGASFHPPPANNWQKHPSPQHGNRQPHDPYPPYPQQQQQQHQHQQQQQQQQQHQHQQQQQLHRHGSKNKKSKSHAQDQRTHQRKVDAWQEEEAHDVWGLGDGWSDGQDEEEQHDVTHDAWGRKVHFSRSPMRASMLPSSASVAPSAVVENITVNALPQNKLGLSAIPMSKTLSYAYSGTTPSTESEPGRAAMQRISDFHFVESGGEALKGVQRAFYGKQRRASDRFHWLFPSEKDERVSSILSWINSMSFGIASFGLQKYLQTRERGALVINAAYRPVHSPSVPAFDWLTWNQIQLTMDRILQESVGYYNPAMHIIVFVFLPSPSGNSIAIWRRKLPIPNNIRLAYQAQITQAMASLRKEYPVLVDELPLPPEPIPPPPLKKKKRKWYKLWLST